MVVEAADGVEALVEPAVVIVAEEGGDSIAVSDSEVEEEGKKSVFGDEKNLSFKSDWID